MMSGDMAIYLSKQMLWQAVVVTTPIVAVAMICGLVVSILQAVTQIQDSTLSFVPKILAALLMLMLCGGWMLHSLTDYAQNLFIHIPEALR